MYYLDGQFAAGTDQTPDAAQTAAALDAFPDTIQWAMYPQGAFLGIDMGVLELGIVRDSHAELAPTTSRCSESASATWRVSLRPRRRTGTRPTSARTAVPARGDGSDLRLMLSGKGLSR